MEVRQYGSPYCSASRLQPPYRPVQGLRRELRHRTPVPPPPICNESSLTWPSSSNGRGSSSRAGGADGSGPAQLLATGPLPLPLKPCASSPCCERHHQCGNAAGGGAPPSGRKRRTSQPCAAPGCRPPA